MLIQRQTRRGKNKKEILKRRVEEFKLVTNFCEDLKSIFGTKKNKAPTTMETHTRHRLLLDILPVALEGLSCPKVYDAIPSLSRLMRGVCAKEIDPAILPGLQVLVAETVTKLEKAFPPSFMDCQVHLLVHLPQELWLYGPVHTRWMYLYERYMGVIKSYGRNCAKLEGSICEGHLQSEAMFLCGHIVKQLGSDCEQLWSLEHTREEERNGQVLMGAKSEKNLSAVEFDQVTNYMMWNSSVMEDWLSIYKTEKSNVRIEELHAFPSFWTFMQQEILSSEEHLRTGAEPSNPPMDGEKPEITSKICSLVNGPATKVMSYLHMWNEGSHLWVYASAKKKRMDDPAVTSVYSQPFYSGLQTTIPATRTLCTLVEFVISGSWHILDL